MGPVAAARSAHNVGDESANSRSAMNRQYKAFISYSWSDKEWGAWLHRTLEIYRTPKQLVGAETPLGPAPTRLHPIFKDREEEAAGHGIGAAIEEAMGASEFLIVLCSPRSAKSKWVNREVAWFKTRKSKERILALVVDGEPGASLSQTATGEECFPATLLYKVDENLQPTQELEDVPLAADARKEGDGKRIAKLKLAAALLGVGLDDLVKRDDRRRAARRRWAMSGMAASMMVLSGLTVFAFQQRDAARVAQAEAEKALQNALDQYGQAEGLIEYMIGDLRHKLQQEVQLKVLSDIATRAQDYYDKQVTIRIDDDGLGRRARVLDLLSALEQDFGNNDKSLQLARASVAASSQLLSREPNNPQRLIDHAHGVQGLGNLAYHLGDLDEAEIRMQEAVRLTERLQKIDSENEEWRAEYGSALANLGIVQLQRRDIEKSSSNLNLALIYRREFASMSPGNRQAQWELGTLLFWLEEIELQRGNKEKAFEYRAQQNGIYQLVLKNNPDDEVFSNALIMNRMREAKHYLLLGEAEAAAKISRPLLKEVEKKLLSYPDRTDYMSHSANALLVLAETEFTLGNIENSWGCPQMFETSRMAGCG